MGKDRYRWTVRIGERKESMQGSQLVIGILAHVDAGKTTLSEALLYTCGALRRMGRVDHGDAFLEIGRAHV